MKANSLVVHVLFLSIFVKTSERMWEKNVIDLTKRQKKKKNNWCCNIPSSYLLSKCFI
uniref:Uncharacterized protein n=1 Tax=Anguilla anguilla TaxID=7936 RepID=A0A0E9RBV1_ANGAN